MRASLHILQQHSRFCVWRRFLSFTGPGHFLLSLHRRLPTWCWLLRVDMQHPSTSRLLGGEWPGLPHRRPTWTVIVLLGRYHHNISVCTLRHLVLPVLYRGSPDATCILHRHRHTSIPCGVRSLPMLVCLPDTHVCQVNCHIPNWVLLNDHYKVRESPSCQSICRASLSFDSPELVATPTLTPSPPTPSSTLASPASPSSRKSSTPAIVGGVIGGIILAIVFGVIFLRWRKRRTPSFNVVDLPIVTSPSNVHSGWASSMSGPVVTPLSTGMPAINVASTSSKTTTFFFSAYRL